MTSIGQYAFLYCNTIRTVTIPNTVNFIGDNAFSECGSLRSVKIPNSVEEISTWAFSNCESLESIDIPNSVKIIGKFAFSNCTSLTGVTIPDSVTSLGDAVFYECDSLREVTIGNSVKRVGHGFFQECGSLETVTFGNSVTSIGPVVFADCYNLTKIVIPKSVTSIHDTAIDTDDCEYVTIYGYKGSYAEKYATKYGIPFYDLGYTPVVVPTEPQIPDEPVSTAKRGDSDGDGEVTVLDATRIQRLLAELCDIDGSSYTGKPLSAAQIIISDADNDGEVTIMDATAIQRYMAELPAFDGIGKPVDYVDSDAGYIRNFNNLISYINSNYDDIDSEGNKYISDVNYDSKGGLQRFYITATTSGKIEFFIYIDAKYDENSEFFVDFLTDFNTGFTIKPNVLFMCDYGGYDAVATVDARNYCDDTTLYFAKSSSGVALTSSENGLANNTMRLAFVCWDTLLYRRTGMELQDIGYKSYSYKAK